MSIQEKIIKKLENEIYPELNFEMIYKLTNESERGAVLIGTSKIEEFLNTFILKILPKDSKNYTSKLLKYPGPISSFSSKSELLFAFRYINKRFYNSLNKLRKLRNEAAHSSQEFNLTEQSELINEICEFEEDMGYVINELSMNNLLKIKRTKLEKIYQDKNLTIDNEYVEKTLTEFKNSYDGLKQHRIWQLSYGVVFMCLYCLVLIDENSYLENKEQNHPLK